MNKRKLKKIIILIGSTVFLYACISILFYWLMGEQLHYRYSRNNIESLPPTSGIVELLEGTEVAQLFHTRIELIERLNVQVGTYFRANSGTVTLRLIDESDGIVIAQQHFDSSVMSEGQMLELVLTKPYENVSGHVFGIRMTANSVAGSAISPLMNKDKTFEDRQLYCNDEPVDGVLCFSITGRDYVWTGLHYWKLVVLGGLIVLVAIGIIMWKYITDRHSLLLDAVNAIKKYRFLIDQMVARDFKSKYKRSMLGMLWSFLNPLMMMLVQYFVFSTLFKSDIPYYHVYLLTGIVIFNFFSEACNMTLMSIVGNSHLLMKVYMPKYIYPLVRVLSSSINLLLSMIPLMLVIVFSGVPITKAYLLVLFPLACLILFSLGVGMFLSTSMVFFRDTQFLWGVISMVWMYATPIFYPISILPEEFAFVLKINPLYYYIDFIRTCVLQGVSPEPSAYALCAFSALISLLVGVFVFKKNQDKFVFYL